MASPPTAKADRERGTPSHNPLKHPRVLLCIVVVICTALSVLACRPDTERPQTLFSTGVGAALGSISAVICLVFTTDSSIHALAFGTAVFLSTAFNSVLETDDLHHSIARAARLAAGPLAVGVATKLPPVRKVCSIFATRVLLNPMVVSTTMSIPLISLIVGSILVVLTPEETDVSFSPVVPAMVGIATQVVLALYFNNKGHKHGSLISKEMKGTAVATACSIGYSIQASMVNAPMTLLPVLVGALVTTLLCAVFCSVADVWFAVGTGQFLMVSMDTAGLLLYFVAPIVVLMVRFMNQYGEALNQQFVSLVQTTFDGVVPTDVEYPTAELITSGILFTVAAGTMVGVPLVNALCPLGAHLFGWAYTHGQPNTKRISLIVFMRDLVDESSTPQENESQIQSLCDKLVAKDKESVPALLNIAVTLEDLTKYPNVVKNCAIAGHSIGIALGSKERGNILDVYNEYSKVLKLKPKWCHVDSNGCNAFVISQVAQLGMKIAYWSTFVSVTSMDEMKRRDMKTIRSDVLEANGGSFVYLQNNSGDPNVMSEAIHSVVEELAVRDESDKDGFKFLPLSLVAREDSHMEL